MITSCGYLQVNPPPDVKAVPDQGEQAAWLAAAANMLAAADYGYGADVQEKAESIFKDLTGHFGTHDEGWTDAAMQWWLISPFNEWPGNPYKLVTVIGNKMPPLPWDHKSGPSMIAGYLRQGHIVSVSITWPDPKRPASFSGGHVLNCWGDDLGEKKNSHHTPSHLRVTDSYRNKGGIIQTYEYGPFYGPLPDGRSHQGWSLAYDDNRPFIKHVILLSPVDFPDEGQEALLSRIIVQLNNDMTGTASGLKIDYVHNHPVSTFRGMIIRENGKSFSPKDSRIESGGNQAEWDFGRNGVENGKKYAVMMESSGEHNQWLGLRNGLLLGAKNEERQHLPEFESCLGGMPLLPRYQEVNATGGCVIFSLVFEMPVGNLASVAKEVEVLLQKQYPIYINPEQPVLNLIAPAGYTLIGVKAGHSYGWLSKEEQMEFSNWMVNQEWDHPFHGDTLKIDVNLIGLLPFPEGENFSRRPD